MVCYKQCSVVIIHASLNFICQTYGIDSIYQFSFPSCRELVPVEGEKASLTLSIEATIKDVNIDSTGNK